MPVTVSAQQATAASTLTRPATGPLTWTPAAAGAQGGLWQMITDTLAIERKRRSIVEIDQSTAALQQMLGQLRGVPTDHLDALTRQSDALTQRADQAHGPELRAVRAQLDTLAWLFQQTSAMLVPLIKEGVLLDQYRHNLSSWHEIVGRQYHEALAALSVRLAVLAGVLALILAGGEVWRRMVLRYTAELRRRQQLLLIRKLTLSALVLLIIGLTFFTQLGSFATFAGLITAGVAVAMQSVLTCIVGYFLLIGKYGLRVGDRVQINNVTGEILDLGLIRLHLMELGAEGKLGATGRVVALPNSIVFQATGGLFRQLPGVSLVWHEVVVSLPSDRDYARFKSQLMPLLADALHEVQEAIRQQSRVIRETASTAVSISEPQVQLRLTGGSAEVVIRYPVQVERAAEIDEKVSEAIRGLLAQKAI
jgi:small-conductance mechanosensitive channel